MRVLIGRLRLTVGVWFQNQAINAAFRLFRAARLEVVQLHLRPRLRNQQDWRLEFGAEGFRRLVNETQESPNWVGL